MPLPESYHHMKRVLSDPRSSNNAIALAIKLDPALATRLLKLVNSAFFGFPQSISSVPQAVSLVGRRWLQNLVLSMSAVTATEKTDIKDGIKREIWRHSLMCAFIAKRIQGDGDNEEATELLLSAALLHDIGRLALLCLVPIERQDDCMIPGPDRRYALARERELLGLDHAALGEGVLRQWDLPPGVTRVVACHHAPETADIHQRSARVVGLADALVHLGARSAVADDPFVAEQVRVLGLKTESIEPAYDEAACNLELFSAII